MLNALFQTELTEEELQRVNGGNTWSGPGTVFGPGTVTSSVGGTAGSTVFGPNGTSSSIIGVLGTGNGPMGGYVQSAGITSPYLATEAGGAVGGLSSVPSSPWYSHYFF
jgi:bacteriocin-like protein